MSRLLLAPQLSGEEVAHVPLAPAGYWLFDEFLRRSALWYLNDGKPITITIPDGNRPG